MTNPVKSVDRAIAINHQHVNNLNKRRCLIYQRKVFNITKAADSAHDKFNKANIKGRNESR